MKKSELRQIIKEEINKTLKEQKDIEWRHVASLFENAIDEIKTHDQYAYVDGHDVNPIVISLLNELQDLFGSDDIQFGK